MSVQSKLFYWVTCDHPECDAREPSDYDDINAWADRGQALDSAEGSDWTVTLAGECFCPDHGVDDEEPLEVVS